MYFTNYHWYALYPMIYFVINGVRHDLPFGIRHDLPLVYAMTYPMVYVMTYPMVCWVSRLKRKHDVKSLMFSTQTWWLSGRSGSRSPEICVHLEHYACCQLVNKLIF
jgi:hypothetical protein